jgi:hypothetical protein
VDSVQVTGLQRTRAKVIEDAIDVDNGELLTPGMLDRARRRLKEVPSIRATALEFVPVSGGRAEVRATVTERRLFPIGAAELGEIAFRSIFQQDPRASIGSMRWFSDESRRAHSAAQGSVDFPERKRQRAFADWVLNDTRDKRAHGAHCSRLPQAPLIRARVVKIGATATSKQSECCREGARLQGRDELGGSTTRARQKRWQP